MRRAATEAQADTIIPVEVTIFQDRTFSFVTKTPPTPVLLRPAAGVDTTRTRPAVALAASGNYPR